MLKSLNKLRRLRKLVIAIKRFYLNKVWGMDIHPTAEFSLETRFDKTFPKGVHIGEYSYAAFDAAILTHDTTRNLWTHTYIGRHCFIGARSVIMPGIRIGDECVVGAGAVVTKDVPPRSLVVGNPAVIVRSDIKVGPYGRFLASINNPAPPY